MPKLTASNTLPESGIHWSRMKPLPAPVIPRNTEAERFDNAFRKAVETQCPESEWESLRFLRRRGLSSCCGAKALLILSRKGGMIGCVCLKCWIRSSHVKRNELPDLNCGCCGGLLEPNQETEGRNYYYRCHECNKNWKLADFIPPWREFFPYCGLAADQDFSR